MGKRSGRGRTDIGLLCVCICRRHVMEPDLGRRPDCGRPVLLAVLGALGLELLIHHHPGLKFPPEVIVVLAVVMFWRQWCWRW
jgi:hypothetical protein